MRPFVGWGLVGLWAVVGPVFALWRHTEREPVDCCAPSGFSVALDVFLVALFTLPIAVIGIWLVNRNQDKTPTAALAIVGVGLFLVPPIVGVFA